MLQLKQTAEFLALEDSAQFEQQKESIIKLMQHPRPEAVDILHSVVEQYENPILIKIALTVLSEMDSSEAVAVLSHCMYEHPSRLHRGDAARALGYSRKTRAIAPLKRLLKIPPEVAQELPISEALWAVMCLCSTGLLEADEEWLSLLEIWQGADAEARILASAILECLNSLKTTTSP